MPLGDGATRDRRLVRATPMGMGVVRRRRRERVGACVRGKRGPAPLVCLPGGRAPRPHVAVVAPVRSPAPGESGTFRPSAFGSRALWIAGPRVAGSGWAALWFAGFSVRGLLAHARAREADG